MPRSLIGVVEELSESVGQSRNAPTRFDLYDLQKSIDTLIDALDKRTASTGDLENEVSRLSDQVDILSKAITDLKSVVEKLA